MPSAAGGNGIFANTTGTGGNIALTTLTGTTVRAGFVGVYGYNSNAANAGTVNVTNNGFRRYISSRAPILGSISLIDSNGFPFHDPPWAAGSDPAACG